MSNRKATFAKRQREMDLKEKAQRKAAAKAERANQPKAGKGPQIDWSDPNYLAAQEVPTDPADPAAPTGTPDDAAPDASTDE